MTEKLFRHPWFKQLWLVLGVSFPLGGFLGTTLAVAMRTGAVRIETARAPVPLDFILANLLVVSLIQTAIGVRVRGGALALWKGQPTARRLLRPCLPVLAAWLVFFAGWTLHASLTQPSSDNRHALLFPVLPAVTVGLIFFAITWQGLSQMAVPPPLPKE